MDIVEGFPPVSGVASACFGIDRDLWDEDILPRAIGTSVLEPAEPEKSMRQTHTLLCILLSLSSLSRGASVPAPHSHLHSEHLGGGLFLYEFTRFEDRFFVDMRVGELVLNFSNLVEIVQAPAGTTYEEGWVHFPLEWDAPVPGVATWRILLRSSLPATRVQPGSAMELGGFGYQLPFWPTTQVVYFQKLDALVPCPVEPAPPTPWPVSHEARFSMRNEFLIDELRPNPGGGVDLTFTLDQQYSLLIEGRDGGGGWRTLGHVLGESGVNHWSSGRLDDSNLQFRLGLLAFGHVPSVFNPYPLPAAPAPAPTARPQLRMAHAGPDRVEVLAWAATPQIRRVVMAVGNQLIADQAVTLGPEPVRLRFQPPPGIANARVYYLEDASKPPVDQ